ncbi:DNA repair protein RecO [Patescibacteria group bacterium]|nr:DNA repair protein RecO [Patescibacteria group bacterium]
MPHSYTYDALVLKAYDVGEADRFLVLLTRERGRISARARAVRKMKSRLGGSLLPYQYITVGLVEGSAGMIVTSAQCKSETQMSSTNAFLFTEQGIEILLSLLHEEEPLPEIFDLTLAFLNKCQTQESDPVLPFIIKLLALMGLSPAGDSEEEKLCIQKCLEGSWSISTQSANLKLKRLCSTIITDQTSKEFKVAKIASQMR